MGQPEIMTHADGIMLLIWLVIFSIGMIAALLDDSNESPEGLAAFKKRRQFWLRIAAILATLMLVGPVILANVDFFLFSAPATWIIVAVLCLGLLTVTLVPAIAQNPDLHETEAVVVFLAYSFPVVIYCLSYVLPHVDFLILLPLAFTLEYVAVVLIITLGSYDLFKGIAKGSMNLVAFGLYLFEIAFIVFILYLLYFYLKNSIF